MSRGRIIILTSLLALLAAGPVSAISLNPFNWFVKAPAARPAATPEEEARAQALLVDAEADLEAGKQRAALRGFEKIRKQYPTAQATPYAIYEIARAKMNRGKWKKAFQDLQFIVQRHPNYPEFDQVVRAQFDIASALHAGARGRILFVIPGFRRYGEAIEYYEQVVHNAPYSDYAPLALLSIALVAQERNDPDIAIDALDRLINYYPQSLLASDAYVKLADTYASLVKGHEYDQGSTRDAISYYEDFLILFPQSDEVAEVEAGLRRMQNLYANSRLHLGEFYYVYRNNNTAALIFYNEAITIAPESESAAIARQRIADIETGLRPNVGYRTLRKILFVD